MELGISSAVTAARSGPRTASSTACCACRASVAVACMARSIRVSGLARLHPVGLVNIPAAVLATLLGLDNTLVDAEVPVHVDSLGSAARIIGSEATATLCARRAKIIVHEGQQVRTELLQRCGRKSDIVRDVTQRVADTEGRGLDGSNNAGQALDIQALWDLRHGWWRNGLARRTLWENACFLQHLHQGQRVGSASRRSRSIAHVAHIRGRRETTGKTGSSKQVLKLRRHLRGLWLWWGSMLGLLLGRIRRV